MIRWLRFCFICAMSRILGIKMYLAQSQANLIYHRHPMEIKGFSTNIVGMLFFY